MSDTYLSTADHVFTRVAAIRARAVALLEGSVGSEGLASIGADVAAERRAEADAIELRLPALVRRFGLTALEEEALVCLVAAEYDPVVRTLERALQREVGRPWMEVGTLAELLGLPADRVPELARSLYPDAPLRRWALVHTDDPSASEVPAVFTRVKIASRVAQHLIGQDHLPEGVRLCDPPRPLLDKSLVAPAVTSVTVTRLKRARAQGEPLVVEISGVPGTGRHDYAEGLAYELGMPVVLCDLDEQLTDDRATRLDERVAVARREAALAGALLGLSGWAPRSSDAPPLADEAHGPPRDVQRRLARAIERLCAQPDDVLFLFSEERETLLGRATPLLVNVQIPFPSPGQRAALLEAAVTRLGGQIDPAIDVQNLTRRFALDPARLEVAARAARELATERGHDTIIGANDLQEACRHQLSHDLKSLAQRVTNSHKWQDLVIPVDVYHSLKEMISYVRHAERVYDSWGFGARHSLAQGVSALFAGPPGTGKTMCASVMARELDMELFRVDLSRIVSKWIGETEKNLGKIFDEADRSNAIILFDEADALFAKRTEVKSSVDRYANLEINFLLQRMEAFGGVTILTTNFEDTIDTAFKRRLTFRMRFEKPDSDARAALWTKIFPLDAHVDEDVDATELGALYELAGGNIRNAAVRAAFLAAEAGTPINHRMCMLAAEREAREMGLLVRSQIEPAREEQEPDEEAPPAREEKFTNLAQPEAASGRPSRVIPVTRPRRQS
ncbi:MAG: ATP-binding protein [Polyangia bacterium]